MTPEQELDDSSNDPTYDSPNILCPRCREKATDLCSGCRNIKYCSPECQQADRPAHKFLCRTYENFTHPPSTSRMRRIVVFLPDEKVPRFTWVPVSIRTGEHYHENERYSEDVEMDDIFQVTEEQAFKAEYTCKNPWAGHALSRTIKVVFDEKFGTNYKTKNQAVQAATQGMDDIGWRGPIIAFCGTLGGGECGLDLAEVYDMDMQAYSYVVGFLISYRNKTAEHAARIGPKVDCVKVACKGDLDIGIPPHQVVRVPRSHPIFVGGGTLSEVSENISMPLFTWKCPNARRSWANPQVTSMHVSCDPAATSVVEDPNRPSFGQPLSPYQHDVGTYLVANATREHFSADVAKAFADFCQWHLTPNFRMFDFCSDVKILASPVEHSEWVLGEVTDAKWTEYQAQWKAEKEAQKTHPVQGYTPEKARSGLERMGLTKEDSWRLAYIICSGQEDRSFPDVYKAFLKGGKPPLEVLAKRKN